MKMQALMHNNELLGAVPAEKNKASGAHKQSGGTI